ncbi:DUF423 domain-containing protein [Ferroacidibacillus organovorans]|uniref:DUF423 domain-containing protein n=1 Tax=Ferroacidibacillus organovorans TaxID=1765683 RepID=A0A853KC75_9BACL|nr:DUF423 domain-containing protein [Ferroacidibacillus organovorans]KYP80587.1 hypothetical protein AYJ22_10740 [Ferroacidibacillus organovorans]OAG92900.1 hypothetical protein AYW79_12885 [Ferroacidibacillus organovorans]
MNFIGLGALFLFLAVALGAFGAHALRARLEQAQLAVYQTGIQYHLIHGLAIVIVGVIALVRQTTGSSSLLTTSGVLFAVGIILFSGSLYLLAMTGIRKLGAITPFGGLFFLAGWITLLIASFSL